MNHIKTPVKLCSDGILCADGHLIPLELCDFKRGCHTPMRNEIVAAINGYSDAISALKQMVLEANPEEGVRGMPSYSTITIAIKAIADAEGTL